jgi:hypothetical protein
LLIAMRQFSYPVVNEVRTPPADRPSSDANTAKAARSQRERVLASLLRCPDRASHSKGKPT